MAKAKKTDKKPKVKSNIDASQLFHNIMKASVTTKIKTVSKKGTNK